MVLGGEIRQTKEGIQPTNALKEKGNFQEKTGDRTGECVFLLPEGNGEREKKGWRDETRSGAGKKRGAHAAQGKNSPSLLGRGRTKKNDE